MKQAKQDCRFRLSLLGPFTLAGPDGARVDISSRKGMALLAMLATAPTGERTRAWLQEQLWGSRGEEQAQASLRRELANLKAALGDDGALLLQGGRDRIRLDLERIAVDIRSPSPLIGAAVPAGAFLEGIDISGEDGFEDWLRAQRRYFEEREASLQAAREAGDIPAFQQEAPQSSLVRIAFLPQFDAGDAAIEQCAEGLRTGMVRTPTVEVSVPWPPSATGDASFDPLTACNRAYVDFLVSATIRRAGEQIVIAPSLTDCRGRRQIWADTIAGPDTNMAGLLTMATTRIESALERASMERARHGPASASDPMHLFFQADALFRRFDRDALAQATALGEQAIAADNGNIWALSLASFCHAAGYATEWVAEPETARALAYDRLERALLDGSDDPLALGYCAGTLLSVGGDLGDAERLVDRALELQPDSVSVLLWGGWVDLAAGRFDRARARLEAVLDINPRSNARPFTLVGLGLCLIAGGHPDAALVALTEAVQRMPHYPPGLAGLATAQAQVGRHADSRQTLRRLDAAGGFAPVARLLRHTSLVEMMNATLHNSDETQPQQAVTPQPAG